MHEVGKERERLTLQRCLQQRNLRERQDRSSVLWKQLRKERHERLLLRRQRQDGEELLQEQKNDAELAKSGASAGPEMPRRAVTTTGGSLFY